MEIAIKPKHLKEILFVKKDIKLFSAAEIIQHMRYSVAILKCIAPHSDVTSNGIALGQFQNDLP